MHSFEDCGNTTSEKKLLLLKTLHDWMATTGFFLFQKVT